MRALENVDDFKASTLGSYVCAVMYSLPGCAVCERVAPLYAAFPPLFPGAVWCQSHSSEVASAEGVEAFPTFDVFRRGKKVARLTGGDALPSVQEAVRELLRGRVTALTEEVLLMDWQPPQEQLALLKAQTGAKTIINLRDPTEKGYVSAQDEAAAAGIEHADEVGIYDVQDVTVDYLRKACNAINKAEKPVVVHCLVGLTAALVGCVNEAKKRGLGAQEVGQWMADLGPYNLSSMSRVVAVVNEYLKSGDEDGEKKSKEKKEKKKSKDKKDKKDQKTKDKDGKKKEGKKDKKSKK